MNLPSETPKAIKRSFSQIFNGFSGFPGGSAGKNPPTMQEPQETQVQSLSQEDPLEKGMAAHFSILVWKIPWTVEPGGL